SRSTIVAYDSNSAGSLAQALGAGSAPSATDFGLRATSVDANGAPDNANEIVVERPMYVNAVIASQPPAINDGHDTLGFQFPAGEVPPLPGAGADVRMVSKTASVSSANAGDQIVYTLVVTNDGPNTATGVVVEDALPQGMTFVGDASTAPAQCRAGTSGNPSAAGAANCIPNGSLTLAPGATATMAFSVSVSC